jgi:predicted ferric reductase
LLLVAHAALTTAGLALADHVSLAREIGQLIRSYPGVITATAALMVLCAVGVSSLIIVRRRLRYETWYFVHLYTYLAIALAFSHQVATGNDFVGAAAARAYWVALYLLTLGLLVVFRLVMPLVRAARHRLRVESVLTAGPGFVSIEISGRRLEQLRARPGQFFLWRFMTRHRWWQAHPFSLSAAPSDGGLRITVKECGDFTRDLAQLPRGTRVLAEGPFGTFTADARLRRRVVLIAGGAGITAIRALLESIPGRPGEIVLLYRAARPEDLLFRDELDELARTRGAEIHYLTGRDDDLSEEQIARLVPDVATRDAFVCGPPAMVEATRKTLRGVGLPARQIVTERFAF